MLALNKNINMTANCGISESICLVCNFNLEMSSCFNIFYTSLPRNGEMLASFVLGVLHPVTSLHSSYICSQCYNLFVMLEQAQCTVKNIQNEILKIYQSSKYGGKITIKNEIIINNDDDNEIFIVHSNSQDKLGLPNNFNGLNEIQNFEELNNTNNNDIAIINSSPKKIINLSTTSTHITESSTVIQTHHDSTVGIEESNIIHNELDKLNSDTISFSNQNIVNSKEILTIVTENAAPNESIPGEISRLDGVDDNQNKSDVFNTESNIDNLKESNNKKKNLEKSIKKPGKRSKINNEKPFKYSCLTCGKKWKTSSDLKAHIKTHSDVRPFMCEKCGQAYKHKHALEIHVGMHNGINPFQCCFCSKSFTQKGALMRHLPLHTGETPYQCELCGKRFVHHTSYNMHILSHTGKKSHQCPICDLSLLSSSHLKRHMRVHTGEKPYTCSSCGKKFAERYNLLAHQKIHDSANVIKTDKNVQYKCKYCNQLFMKQVLLDEHIEQQHKVQTQAENDSSWLPERLHSGDVKQNSSGSDTEWQSLSYDRIESLHEAVKNGSSDSYKGFDAIIRTECQESFN